MFKNLFGEKCPRCDHKNSRDAEFCGFCNISLAVGTNSPVILKNNRWEAAEHEFAAFFKSNDLKGIFSKSVQIPAGMQAYVLQGTHVELLPEGEHTVEDMLVRLKGFFGSNHGEVLITRKAALPIAIALPDVLSAEYLKLKVNLTALIQIGSIENFKKHFMLRVGAVTIDNIRDLVAPMVAQSMKEFIGARSIKEMVDDGALRTEIKNYLQQTLTQGLSGLGLAFVDLQTIDLYHEALEEIKEAKGQLWLLRESNQIQIEEQRTYSDMYSQLEWEKIYVREKDLTRRARNGELDDKAADIAFAARARELRNLDNIFNCNTRAQAMKMGAQDSIDEIENGYLKKKQQREHEVLKSNYEQEDEITQWSHIRQIAQIQRDAEIEVRRMRQAEQHRIEKMRIDNELEKQNIISQIEISRLIEDEEERRKALELNAQNALRASARTQLILDAQNELDVDTVDIRREVNRRTQVRVQDWEDVQLSEKIASVQVRIEKEKNNANIEHLEKLIRLDDLDETLQWERENKKERARWERDQTEKANAFDRELKMKALASEDKDKEIKARLDELSIFGSLPVEAMIHKSTQNPEVLIEMIRSSMTEGQINASKGTSASMGVQGSITDAINATANQFKDLFEKMSANKAEDRVLQDKHVSDLQRAYEGSRDAIERMHKAERDTDAEKTKYQSAGAQASGQSKNSADDQFARDSAAIATLRNSDKSKSIDEWIMLKNTVESDKARNQIMNIITELNAREQSYRSASNNTTGFTPASHPNSVASSQAPVVQTVVQNNTFAGKQCPNCKIINSSAANFCSSCGTSLNV